MSTHNVLSYAKRIDDICLGEWWQSKKMVLCVKNFGGYSMIKYFKSRLARFSRCTNVTVN
ncbi:hypothetical protein EGT73_18990 [Acinetobacter johnsonii]|uniref:Uncharacterized protein n=1 Tax=Acinetobacter johnsonii TaxID=40214 RepID=A0A427UJ05_ACIJO|nr:hypothetical protein EGT73_18990 [Acinetobacter johnsonii]